MFENLEGQFLTLKSPKISTLKWGSLNPHCCAFVLDSNGPFCASLGAFFVMLLPGEHYSGNDCLLLSFGFYLPGHSRSSPSVENNWMYSIYELLLHKVLASPCCQVLHFFICGNLRWLFSKNFFSISIVDWFIIIISIEFQLTLPRGCSRGLILLQLVLGFSKASKSLPSHIEWF